MVAGSHAELLAHLTSWNGLDGRPIVVTFAFDRSGGPAAGPGFSPAQRDSVRSALGLWDAASGLAFVETPASPATDITFRFAELGSIATLGRATLPPEGGDVALNARLFATDSLAPHPTRIGFQVVLHEIGHSLGLSHPQADSALALANTVMVSVLGRVAPSNALLPWDVAAIQAIYGTPEAEAALGLAWRWDAALAAVRGEGTPGDDRIDGTAMRDALHGAAGRDLLAGHGGDDLLLPGAGDDVIQGGAGFDTLVLHTTRAGLTLDLAAGTTDSEDGRDRYEAIEAIRLLDGTLYLAAPQGLAPLVGLYRTMLDRAPDAGGLAFWWQHVQHGMALTDIARLFMASGEFQARSLAGEAATQTAEALAADALAQDTAADVAAGLWLADADALLVAGLYATAFARAPDAAGFLFWTAALAAGADARTVAEGFLASDEAAQAALPWDDAADLLAAAQRDMWTLAANGVLLG